VILLLSAKATVIYGFFFRLSEFFFYPLLARLEVGAGVEQPFGCLIVQNLRPCSLWGIDGLDSGGRHGPTVCSAPHSQAAEEAILHLYKQERKRPKLVRRRLSGTKALLGRVIPGVCVPASGIEVRSLVGLSVHFAFH